MNWHHEFHTYCVMGGGIELQMVSLTFSWWKWPQSSNLANISPELCSLIGSYIDVWLTLYLSAVTTWVTCPADGCNSSFPFLCWRSAYETSLWQLLSISGQMSLVLNLLVVSAIFPIVISPYPWQNILKSPKTLLLFCYWDVSWAK